MTNHGPFLSLQNQERRETEESPFSSHSPRRGLLRRFCALGAVLLLLPAALRAEEEAVVAVYSSASPGYTRTKLPNGTFRPETYTFGEGQDLGGAMKDFTIDRLKFIDIAKRIAPALSHQNYLPNEDRDPAHTDLLIMVYWGTTTGTDNSSSSAPYQTAQALQPPPRSPVVAPSGGKGGGSPDQSAGMLKAADDSALNQEMMIIRSANVIRDRQNLENARILGYLPELDRIKGLEFTALRQRRQDVVDEIEETRYYVVLLAYDFRLIWKEKKRKILWETRFSIPQRGNDFSKALTAMATNASRYFGQDSSGLIRKKLPRGDVELGTPEVIGTDPAPEPKK